MPILLDNYNSLSDKPFKHLSKKGRIKAGFRDDFNAPIWVDKFGIPPVKCIPVFEEMSEEFAKNKDVGGEEISPKEPKGLKGKVEEKSSIHGVPIYKMAITDKKIANPITPKMIKDAFSFFKIPKDHFKELEEIVIANELPGKKWAFGTYNIRKRGKKFIDNRITIWAQKTTMMNGEVRYVINPSNVPGELFLSSARLHYELLGDTIVHELGHHFDLWINESPMNTSGWVVRAENHAEKYTRSFASIKRRSEEFLNKMIEYGSDDNDSIVKKAGKGDSNTIQDVEMTSKETGEE